MNILSFSNFIPEQLCDTIRFFGLKGDVRISHYCQYAADFISKALRDPEIDGAVFPKSCDSCRVLGSYLEGCGKFVYQLHVPARRDGGAAAYFTESLRRYRRAVEAHYGVELTDIPQRATLVNQRNRTLEALYERLPEVSYCAYLSVPDTLPGCASPGGHRVFVMGSTLADTGLMKQIEAAGLNIVGDRLPESRRLFSTPEVSPDGDIYENIAASVLRTHLSPTQNGAGHRDLCGHTVRRRPWDSHRSSFRRS